MRDVLEQIVGGPELSAWFGGIPTFADGPVLDFRFSIENSGSLRLRTWPLDPSGNYRHSEPGEVTFRLERISALELVDLKPHSVVDTFTIRRSAGGYTISIEAAFGLHGTVEAEDVQIHLRLTTPSEVR